jgi:hypothetical protein
MTSRCSLEVGGYVCGYGLSTLTKESGYGFECARTCHADRDEIREAILQVAIYCGIPASLDAHNIAMEVFAEGH